MKNIAIVVALGLLGAVAAFAYLKFGSGDSAGTSSTPSQVADPHAGHDHPPGEDDGHAAESAGEALLHGATAVPADEALCEKHRIPERLDAFCHPELVQSMGYCKGHDVAEAFCTRCSPILIAAFKAEGDWCAEHGLPESQCKLCQGG
jgi:hypothetical protein